MKAVSSSNTKNEILEAYQELLSMVDAEKKQNKQLLKQIEEKDKIVSTVKENAQNSSTSLEDLKTSLIQKIDDFKNKMEDERENFNRLQEAVKIQKEELEAINNIKAELGTIDALVLAHKQAKEKLDDEIQQYKQDWEREKEAYLYNLKIQKRNDEDKYEQKKNELEKALIDKKTAFENDFKLREDAIKEHEERFKELEAKEKEYEKSLKTSVDAKEKEVAEKLTREFEYNKKLENKDLETEIKLLKLEIEGLTTKVQEQQQQIAQLNKKAEDAGLQVKEIAMKAIEGNATKPVQMFTEKNKE